MPSCCCTPPTALYLPPACSHHRGAAPSVFGLRGNESLPHERRYLDAVCGSTPVNGTACFRRADTGGHLCVPSFVGLGFAKAGTTKLYELILSRPGVAANGIKEAHFFEGRARDRAGAEYTDFFHYLTTWNLTNAPAPVAALGEFTPEYTSIGCEEEPTKTDKLIQRLTWLLPPSARFIFAMREPVARALSHFAYFQAIHRDINCGGLAPGNPGAESHLSHQRCSEILPRGLAAVVCHAVAKHGSSAFLHAHDRRLAATDALAPPSTTRAPWCPTFDYSLPGYSHWDLLTPGLYHDSIAPVVARLGRERFAFVDMADIASGGALRDVEACLGLPAHAYASAQLHAPSSNAGSRAADPVAAAPAAVVRFLRRFYAPSNNLTFSLTGVGGNWVYPPEEKSSAELLHALCRHCVRNETTRLTMSCH